MINKIELINKILVVADPMGLIYDDEEQYNEYVSESKSIAKYIEINNPGSHKLAKYIRQVFISYFETCLELDICELIADCIIINLNSEE